MEQFFRAKQAHPDALLFFRMGDFYEMFFEDAVLAAELLDLTLTSRGSDEHGIAIPMAGVPHHAASTYIARLLERGQRVALCEQMEDPSKVKGVVPRAVVRVITPGLVLDPDALDARAENYLASLSGSDEGPFGLALIELSTSEARACALPSRGEVIAELVRLSCRELLLDAALVETSAQLRRTLPNLVQQTISDDDARRAALEPSTARLVADMGLPPHVQRAAACALDYAQRSQPNAKLDVARIAHYDPGEQLLLDETAVRNLELITTLSGDRKGSLLHLCDATKTSMGARLLRRRLLSPLTEIAAIRRRHDVVEAFYEDSPLRSALRDELARVADLERLSTRALLGVATPRDLGALVTSLCAAERTAAILQPHDAQRIDDHAHALAPQDVCPDVAHALREALCDEPPASAAQGNILRDGFDARVDELRALSRNSKDVILELEQRERERTKINSLKVRFTKVFGYYIEITKSRLEKVPADYRRKQTVAGGERFTTEELEGLQAKILNADERLRALEGEVFEKLRADVGAQASRLRKLGHALAELDVHSAFAELAQRNQYVRPQIDDSLCIELSESRHPIVEQAVEAGRFVPNDVALDAERARLMVITGPNMAGKSTAMRQVALCVILAQSGGFVPASRARIGVVDRIYTRVGASDNVAEGHSTFMVEMRETAAMLRGATKRSLVVLDEIGRGTSTYDGLAIAWAVAEHLHDALACRAMFATHYHELCELAGSRDGVVNFNVAAREVSGAGEEEIVFLRRLVPGGANRSYGLAVARLAGIPPIVLARARTMLDALEASGSLPVEGGGAARSSPRQRRKPDSAQLDIFGAAAEQQAEPEALRTLRALDVDHMTPVEALVALARLKQLLPPR
jgi:DNA mismatch repair protein MutS